jgi:hypothetical protein
MGGRATGTAGPCYGGLPPTILKLAPAKKREHKIFLPHNLQFPFLLPSGDSILATLYEYFFTASKKPQSLVCPGLRKRKKRTVGYLLREREQVPVRNA